MTGIMVAGDVYIMAKKKREIHKEPSSAAGIGTIIAALAPFVPQPYQGLVAAIGVIAGMVAVALPESDSSPSPSESP